ncbi:COG1470 family protein [Nonomuraea guangzhouensis]|uniref:Peptidase n=1 Tax=Nonomuraea guangzhouensis TaxID=1291555 RepID=A0ABW4GFG6_9ACTN|nr:hypothetical protein [Nonomuraea guangzhouensis]
MPTSLLRRPVYTTLMALLLHVVISAPAVADSESRDGTSSSGRGGIGIKLLEVPANRMDDPRSRVFIVDHVNPGTTFTRSLEVYSTSREPQHVELYAAAAGIRGGRFTFAPDRTSNELSEWVRLNRSSVDLPANGRTRVKATVAVPQWASKGERYAVVWAQVSSDKPGAKGNVKLVHRVGIRSYLDVGSGGEPPSDFEIGEVVPGRAEDGQLKIVVDVSNTGERALDFDGELSLSDGPSFLRAGPFPVNRDTTLAPGDQGNVIALMGNDLPAGPWRFHLTLRSGRVSHTATGTLTFPEKPGTWGLPGSLDSPWTLALAGAGLTALIAGVVLLVAFRRFRTRQPSSGN